MKFYEKKLFSACLVISLFSLGLSFYAEYALGKSVCTLCLFQRWPYAVAVLMALIGIFSRFSTLVIYALLGIFLFEFGVSTYHLLVQYGVVSDPCSVPKITNPEEFWRVLNAPLPCSKITWKFLEIPATGYNVLISINLSFLLGIKFHRKLKTKAEKKLRCLTL